LLMILVWTFRMDFVLFHLFPFTCLFSSPAYFHLPTCFHLPWHTTSGPACRLQSASLANVPLMSVTDPSRCALALSWAIHGEGGYQIVNKKQEQSGE
jgi:hypothetical protein